MDKRGLRYAIDHLKGVYPTGMIPDDVYHQASITGLVSSLAHSLRRAARGGKGKVLVTYHPDNSGHNVAYYRWNPDYKAPQTPANAPRTAKPLYFYTRALRGLPSAYYLTLESVHLDIRHAKLANPGLDGFHIWSGTTEAPVLVGVVK